MDMDNRETLRRVWISQAHDRYRVSPTAQDLDDIALAIDISMAGMTEEEAAALL